MPSQWFFRSEKGIVGPYSSHDLRALAASGVITEETLVRRGNDGRWIAAVRIENLHFKATEPRMPPVPPSPPPLPKQNPIEATSAPALSVIRRPIESPTAPIAVPNRWAVLLLAVSSAMLFALACVGIVALVVANMNGLENQSIARIAPKPAPENNASEEIHQDEPLAPEPISLDLQPMELSEAVSERLDIGRENPSDRQDALRPATDEAIDRQHTDARPTPSLVDLAADLEKSVVRINVNNGLGSGFLIDELGTVVTNFHVVDGATTIRISFPDGDGTADVGYVALAPEKDLAILRIRNFTDVSRGKTPLKLALALPRKGEDAIALGSPLGLSFSLSRGTVSAVRAADELLHLTKQIATWIQFDCPISPGNSGGPVTNARGEVIAVATAIYRPGESQNLNLGVSSLDVAEVLAQASKDVSPLPIPQQTTQRAIPPRLVSLTREEGLARLKQIQQLDVAAVESVPDSGSYAPPGLKVDWVASTLVGALQKRNRKVDLVKVEDWRQEPADGSKAILACYVDAVPLGGIVAHRIHFAILHRRIADDGAVELAQLWDSKIVGVDSENYGPKVRALAKPIADMLPSARIR